MRIYFPDSNALQALVGTNIDLFMDVSNDKLGALSSDPSAASAWVQSNVQAYPGRLLQAHCGRQRGDRRRHTENILPVMQNPNNALSTACLGIIKVSTAVSQGVTVGYPPSTGTFSSDTSSYMTLPVERYMASLVI